MKLFLKSNFLPHKQIVKDNGVDTKYEISKGDPHNQNISPITVNLRINFAIFHYAVSL